MPTSAKQRGDRPLETVVVWSTVPPQLPELGWEVALPLLAQRTEEVVRPVREREPRLLLLVPRARQHS